MCVCQQKPFSVKQKTVVLDSLVLLFHRHQITLQASDKMGKKARAKKQQRGNGQTSAPVDDRQAMADEEKAQMEVWCRLYIDSFQPLTELKEENRRMRRPLIPVRFSTLMDRHVKPTIYRETVEKIRQRLAGHPLFFSFSFSCNGSCNVNDYAEHIDAINVTVGTLNADKQRGEMFIVHSSENYSSIGKCDRDDDDYDDDYTSNSEFFIQLFKDTLVRLFLITVLRLFENASFFLSLFCCRIFCFPRIPLLT